MTFTIVQKDTAPPISSRLEDSNRPVDLSNASNVFFHMEDRYKKEVVSDDLTGRVNMVDETRGEVEYAFKEETTLEPGMYQAEWQVLYDDGTVETFPSSGKVEIEVTEGIK